MDERPPPPAQNKQATLKNLLLLIGRSALANKGLVIGIILLGLVEAFATKAPIALLMPLGDALGLQQVSAEAGGRWFVDAFESLAYRMRDGLGITFTGEHEHALTLLLGCAIAAGTLGLAGGVAMYGTQVLTRFFAVKIVVDLRNQVANHILHLPLRFFGRRRLGDLISSLTTDTTVLARSFQLAADHAIVDPLQVLGNALLIVVAVPEAVWLLVLMVPVTAFPLIRMGRRVHKRSHKSLAAMGEATESLTQMVSGIRTVKAFQLEHQRLQEFEDSNRLYLRRTRRMLQAKAASQSAIYISYQLAFAGMLLGAGWLMLNNTYDLSELLVVLLSVATTYTHVKRLARSYNTLMESVGGLERIQAVLNEPLDAGAGSTGIALAELRGEVAFDDVGFSYGREPVLEHVSFRVAPGQMVAFVGPSGAGKSTALDLVARFHDPDHGAVRIDGEDLRDLRLQDYRRHIAIVSQQPFLFNASVGDNIRYGRPGASHEQVVAAAKAAQIHDFVMSLPDGYDTLAGERGSNLSGGQMQRITIARAILRDPAILILDEATSSLDSESEEAVQEALNNLMHNRTSLVIAHRLSTVSNADLILVMERGRVVERGTHSELVESDGLYFRLSQLQQLV